MNRQGKAQGRCHRKKQRTWRAFTLVEVLIVVAVLGILAAVIVPEYRDHTQRAKESSAKESLQMLRTAIGRYATDHGLPPGYPLNDPSSDPVPIAVWRQLTPTPNYPDSYLSKLPTNPFNNLSTMIVIKDGQPFPSEADGSTGWIYKPAAKEIRLNQQGTDSQGEAYFDY
jgi:type II secretion system protein G